MAEFHAIDLIRKKRDGGALDDREIAFLVSGAAEEKIPAEQLAAWLMAVYFKGLTLDESRSLTLAMRDSGERFDSSTLGRMAVDKHSTGGVGDKTSFLVAPIAAACGLAVPMISGRALGHTGGTLDKLEAIPGYRTALSLAEFGQVVAECGLSIIGQTPRLVPADRTLYALRDRTGTVESRGLICASILSKKLAAGLNGLVLDVKTGSGAFLRDPAEARALAQLMVATANASGTRTVALLSRMDRPLGLAAGNWIELAECAAILSGEAPEHSRDLRELSLELAAQMLLLGYKAKTLPEARTLAAATLKDGSALRVFLQMVEAHGGSTAIFANPASFHRPHAVREVRATRSGFVAEMETTTLGWAVQRTGAGRERAGEPVDPHAGILFHKKTGDAVECGDLLATLYGSSTRHLDEAEALYHQAISFADAAPSEQVPLVSEVFDSSQASVYSRQFTVHS